MQSLAQYYRNRTFPANKYNIALAKNGQAKQTLRNAHFARFKSLTGAVLDCNRNFIGVKAWPSRVGSFHGARGNKSCPSQIGLTLMCRLGYIASFGQNGLLLGIPRQHVPANGGGFFSPSSKMQFGASESLVKESICFQRALLRKALN